MSNYYTTLGDAAGTTVCSDCNGLVDPSVNGAACPHCGYRGKGTGHNQGDTADQGDRPLKRKFLLRKVVIWEVFDVVECATEPTEDERYDMLDAHDGGSAYYHDVVEITDEQAAAIQTNDSSTRALVEPLIGESAWGRLRRSVPDVV